LLIGGEKGGAKDRVLAISNDLKTQRVITQDGYAEKLCPCRAGDEGVFDVTLHGGDVGGDVGAEHLLVILGFGDAGVVVDDGVERGGVSHVHQCLECAIDQAVIAVGEGDPLAAGVVDAGVARLGEALVDGLVDDTRVGVGGGILPEHGEGVVGAGVVDKDDFVVVARGPLPREDVEKRQAGSASHYSTRRQRSA